MNYKLIATLSLTLLLLTVSLFYPVESKAKVSTVNEVLQLPTFGSPLLFEQQELIYIPSPVKNRTVDKNGK